MARVVWPDRVLDQLDDIVAYIEMFDSAAAEDIRRALLAAGESLVDFPRRGRPGPYGTRELVTVPPYIIRYDVSGDRVTIVQVRHERQRPQ